MLKRCQGRTWVWPRLLWLLMLVVAIVFWASYFFERPATNSPGQELVSVMLGFFVLLPFVLLLPHWLATATRLEETCVWCHIVQRKQDGSIEATLLVLAYRLPFLDLAGDDPVPWQRPWWKSTNTDIVLQTGKNVSQLNHTDIYDENVCTLRPLTAIPPTARRYVVKRVERQGDIVTKEKRRLGLRFGSATQAVVVATIGAAPGVISLLVALLKPAN